MMKSHAYRLNKTVNKNIIFADILHVYVAQYVRGLVVAGGGFFNLLPRFPRGREGPTSSVFMSVCLWANQSGSRREERGWDLADQRLLRNSWFTFQFNTALPRSPHACLRACQLYWRHGATGQKQLLPKDTPSNYFQWQHTIWWPLRRIKLHMTVTLHHWGGTTPTADSKKPLATMQTATTKKEMGTANVKCACTETLVDGWMCLSLISLGLFSFQDWLHCSRPQTHK